MVEVNLYSAVAVGIVIVLLYHYVAKKYHYFLSKPILCIKPTFLFGSSLPFLLRREKLVNCSKLLYNAYPDAKIIGYYDFMTPTFMVRDPDMIKQIAVKDFDHFLDHTPMMSRPDEDPDADSLFGNSLFALRGQKWRDMRATLSPAFTGSRMRQMFELVFRCSNAMSEYYKTNAAETGEQLEIDAKDAFQRVANDMIATIAFGIEVDSFRDRDNEFFAKGTQLVNFQGFKLLLQFILLQVFPVLRKVWKADFGDPAAIKYFKKMIMDNMVQREAHGIVRNDMVHMLMEARKGALKHEQEERDAKDTGFATVEESQVGRSTHTRVWTDNEIVAQCFLFFFAALDNVSSTMTFLLYELMVNRDVQDRLYEEIQDTECSLNGKPLSYEALQAMKYLDMVVSETLRKWPAATLTDRYCTKDYLYDDGCGTRFTIEKGRTVWIPTLAMHHDARYYPEPERFNPERFSEANRANIVSGTYLTFGTGPRNCVGSRLALMEIKTIIYCLLQDFSVEPTEKTQIPLELSGSAFNLKPDGAVWVELKPRS